MYRSGKARPFFRTGVTSGIGPVVPARLVPGGRHQHLLRLEIPYFLSGGLSCKPGCLPVQIRQQTGMFILRSLAPKRHRRLLAFKPENGPEPGRANRGTGPASHGLHSRLSGTGIAVSVFTAATGAAGPVPPAKDRFPVPGADGQRNGLAPGRESIATGVHPAANPPQLAEGRPGRAGAAFNITIFGPGQARSTAYLVSAICRRKPGNSSRSPDDRGNHRLPVMRPCRTGRCQASFPGALPPDQKNGRMPGRRPSSLDRRLPGHLPARLAIPAGCGTGGTTVWHPPAKAGARPEAEPEKSVPHRGNAGELETATGQLHA